MERTNLKIWRIKHGLTQVELANELGIATAVINRIELGKRNPTIKLIKKFKKVFDVETFDEVFEIFEMKGE